MFTFYPLLALLSVIAASSVSAYANQGVIVGDNDLVVVGADGGNVPERFRNVLNAFGQLTAGCSATHIGNKRVLTAGHCFVTPPRSTPGSCSGLTVWWGNRHGQKPVLMSKCKRVLLRELNRNRDFLVIEVDVAPAEFIELDTTEKASLGEPITIFSHPKARPLEWSGFCMVEDWSGSAKGTDEFNHRCDTEPGSSGAAILSSETGRIIGIHNGGGDDWNYATFSAIPALQRL